MTNTICCLALTIATMCLHSAHGRIGETLNECKTRYGKVTAAKADPQNSDIHFFETDHLNIQVSFDPEGKCWSIKYLPKKSGKPLTDEQENQLILLNTKTNADDWVPQGEQHRHIEWLWRTEKTEGYGAVFAPTYLLIFTDSYSKARLAESKAKKAEIIEDQRKLEKKMLEGL